MLVAIEPIKSSPSPPDDPFLYLTFDDGPGDTRGPLGSGSGPRTYDLASYLRDEKIAATFFVVGRHVEVNTGDSTGVALVQQVEAMGFPIGNHTYSHERLKVLFARNPTNPAREVIRTCNLIEAAIPGKQDTILFRAPGGEWSDAVAQQIRADLLASLKFVGPISWNIDTADYQKWGMPPLLAAEAIFNSITSTTPRQTGIVLMHDSTASDPYLMSTNRTFEIVTELVPMLRGAGYRFGTLEQIPEIKTAIQTPLSFSLQATKSPGTYWLGIDDTGAVRLTSGPKPHEWEKLEAVPIGSGRIAIRCAATPRHQGQYLTVNQTTGLVQLSATNDDSGIFEVVALGPSADGRNRYAFASFNQHSRQNLLRYANLTNPNSIFDANGSTDLPDQTVFTFFNRSYD
jgi:peptidoglycan/xylan/chitin deacetylase (PgdA/CDA1 family)